MRLPYLFLITIILYLGSALFPYEGWSWAVSVISLVIVSVLIWMVKGFVKGLGISMLLIGAWLLIDYGASWQSFILSFGKMLPILSLFALIPLIAIPIELGQYAGRIQMMIQARVKHSGLLYGITSMLSYMSSSFMNLAAIPLVYHTLRPSIELYPIGQKDRFMSRAITHGFSMPTLWTPVTPVVGIVIEMTGAKWGQLLPYVIPFSLVGLGLDIFLAHLTAKRRRKVIDPDMYAEISAARENAIKVQKSERREGSHPFQIVIAILLFNGVLSLLEHFADLSFLLLVTLLVIPFGLVWSMVLRKGKAFITIGAKKLPEHLLKMKEQFFMFLSAGFMISAIQTSGANAVINDGFVWVKDIVGTNVFLLIIPLIPFMLTFLGFQPAVALVLTAESMNPQVIGLAPELTAMAMLMGATAAFMMGPYNATASLMSSLINRSSYRVSNWNAPFTMLFLGLSMIFLIILKNMD